MLTGNLPYILDVNNAYHKEKQKIIPVFLLPEISLCLLARGPSKASVCVTSKVMMKNNGMFAVVPN